MAVRRWIPVALGCLLIVVLCLVGAAASCAYLVRQQVKVSESSSLGDFEREAAAVMRRFEGIPALVTDDDSGPTLSAKALRKRQEHNSGGPPATALHVLVYAEREKKLVRLSVPFWLLRMAPDSKMDFKMDQVDLDKVDLKRVNLTFRDLESAGPGPLFVAKGDGKRVLVWTE